MSEDAQSISSDEDELSLSDAKKVESEKEDGELEEGEIETDSEDEIQLKSNNERPRIVALSDPQPLSTR
jgi:hypothetical protein